MSGCLVASGHYLSIVADEGWHSSKRPNTHFQCVCSKEILCLLKLIGKKIQSASAITRDAELVKFMC